jgi:TolB protein
MRIVSSVALLAMCAHATAQPASPKAEPKRVTTTVSLDAVYSPDGQWVAFASNRDGNDPESLDIYRMMADGTGVRRLTDHDANDEMPAISPDGKRIAFMSTRSGDPEIYVMSADGDDVRRITQDAAWDIHPRWTPDGREILFNSTRGSKSTREPELFAIYAARPDGSPLRQLTNEAGISTYASYSPDGTRIVYRRVSDGNSEVFVMNADGSAKTNLTRNAASDGWPVWSPDGSLIAFASNRGGNENVFEIFVMRANGSDVRQLTTLGFRSTAPEFSRDGRAILFTRAGGGFADLYLVPVSE